MEPGRWVLLVAVVAAVGFGGWRALSDGRFRGTHLVRGGVSTGSTHESGGSTHESGGSTHESGGSTHES
ncbi:MAG: thioredoxin, partial [Nocardioides sp.]